MSGLLSNPWFSSMIAIAMALACYANRQNLPEQWGGLFFLALLLLNTVCLVVKRLTTKEPHHEQPR